MVERLFFALCCNLVAMHRALRREETHEGYLHMAAGGAQAIDAIEVGVN